MPDLYDESETHPARIDPQVGKIARELDEIELDRCFRGGLNVTRS